mmetsp:Transcript_13179/g.37118  ORF Transcript_13179/g.37118 Transcript_13179/m.37118 type:complete len:201 (+) Transcript_13179:1946-2548(+)
MRSRQGMPASANASMAALRAAHRVPPSACKTCTQMSICDRGNSSTMMTSLRVSLITMVSSVDLLSVFPLRRLSPPVLKGAIAYSQLTTALSWESLDLFSSSLGPNTAAITLVLPISKTAEPSAVSRADSFAESFLTSFGLRPSSRSPSGETNSMRSPLCPCCPSLQCVFLPPGPHYSYKSSLLYFPNCPRCSSLSLLGVS